MNRWGRAGGALVVAPLLPVSAAAADLPLHRNGLPPDLKGLWGYTAGDVTLTLIAPGRLQK